MQNSQEDKLSMCLKTESTCDKFQTVWNSNNAFKATYNLLKSRIRLVEQNRDIQITNITGVTSEKAIKRVAMTDKALFIANRLESYARVSANTELLANIHFTASDMDKARDTNIVGICDLILSKANTYATELANYDVPATTITDLQTAITTYTSVVTKPQTSKAILKNATQNIAQYIKEIDELLATRLDLDIEVFKTTNPDFYSQYKTARIIISTGGQTTALSVLINDKNGNPIPKVSALITNIPKNPNNKEVINEISKKTGTKGTFRVVNLVEGNYKIKIRKIGYVEKSLNFTVVNGETTKLILILESISSSEIQ
ncbi:MAG: hypothetical protein A2046_02690 [Bacteroidetes bacterium GWA2_30_7]|nr:MAG: hypothetical protein A2046_02690 [Bacteroidetes bacterium GWA2_30_7]